jgi:hypothetical protein
MITDLAGFIFLNALLNLDVLQKYVIYFETITKSATNTLEVNVFFCLIDLGWENSSALEMFKYY